MGGRLEENSAEDSEDHHGPDGELDDGEKDGDELRWLHKIRRHVARTAAGAAK